MTRALTSNIVASCSCCCCFWQQSHEWIELNQRTQTRIFSSSIIIIIVIFIRSSHNNNSVSSTSGKRQVSSRARERKRQTYRQTEERRKRIHTPNTVLLHTEWLLSPRHSRWCCCCYLSTCWASAASTLPFRRRDWLQRWQRHRHSRAPCRRPSHFRQASSRKRAPTALSPTSSSARASTSAWRWARSVTATTTVRTAATSATAPGAIAPWPTRPITRYLCPILSSSRQTPLTNSSFATSSKT